MEVAVVRDPIVDAVDVLPRQEKAKGGDDMLKAELEKLVEKQAKEIEMLTKANEGLALEIAALKGSFDAEFVEVDEDVSTTAQPMTFDPDTGASTYPPFDRR